MKKANHFVLLTALFMYCSSALNAVMFSNLEVRVLGADGKEETVVFQAQELIEIAQAIVDQTPSDSVTVPRYDAHLIDLNKAVDALIEQVVLQYERQFEIGPCHIRTNHDKADICVIEHPLWEMLRLFYRGDMNSPLCNHRDLYQQLLGLIKDKEKNPCIGDEGLENLIIPPNISKLNTVGKWRCIAGFLGDHYEDIPIEGIWFNVGNRLILLKNSPGERQHFYVSDHGKIEQVLRDTKDTYLRFDDRRRRELMWSFEMSKYLKKLSEEQKRHLKNNFIVRVHQGQGGSSDNNERLLFGLSMPKHYRESMLKGTDELGRWASFIGRGNGGSDLPEESPEAILSTLTQEQYQAYKQAYNATVERIRYKGEIQAPAYINGVYEKELNPFFTQIDQIFHPSDAEKCKVIMTLSAIAKPLGRGAREQLFRPTSSFGSRHEGESYRGFAKAFDRYINLPNHRSEVEIASIMRSILSGGSLQDEDLYFLPNLITAWFISEVSRNSLTLMTNLMLLDLIEHDVPLDSGYGSNWYRWRNALVHPLKDLNNQQDIKIPDLYGNPVHIDEFGGCHPMVQHNSISQSKQKLGIPLTVVRQKEAHLLIDWLALTIKNLPQEQKDQYKVVSAIAGASSSSQQIGKSLNDLIAEKKQKEKKRDKDLGTIRVKKKKNPDADVSKQEKEVAKLVQEIEVLNKEIMNKNPIKTEIIDALLRRRMSTLRLM